MSDSSPDKPSDKPSERPSIAPGTKPKFKVTQSPFSPNLRPGAGSESAEGSNAKPKPAAPKPSALSPLEPTEPVRSTPQPFSSVTRESAAPKTSEPVLTFDEEDEDESSIGEMVAIGLQGVAAIAAIAFTVLAVLENMPFL